MPKNPIISHSAKIKICTLSNLRLRPSGWPRHQHTHTHTQNKWKPYVWSCFGTTSNPPLTSENANWLCWLSRQIWHIPMQTWTEPSYRKLKSPPTKLGMLFSAYLQASIGGSRPGQAYALPGFNCAYCFLWWNIYWWIQQSAVFFFFVVVFLFFQGL